MEKLQENKKHYKTLECPKRRTNLGEAANDIYAKGYDSS